MSDEEKKRKNNTTEGQEREQEQQQPTENYVPMKPPKGARALDNPNVTPENFQQKQGEYTPLVPGITPEQAQRNRDVNMQSQSYDATAATAAVSGRQQKTLQDIQQEQEEHKRDVALIKQANEKLGTSDKEFTELVDEARARRIRQMAMHEIVLVPMHQKKQGDNNMWFNPFTKKWEQDYKREGEDEDAWIIKPFKRYAIDKKSWDEAGAWQVKMLMLPNTKIDEKREMDVAWVEFLAYKFFAMTAEDVALSKWEVLKDYIMSCLYRTNVGLPYYQKDSDGSLGANNPIH